MENRLYLSAIIFFLLKSFQGQHHLEIKLISVTNFTECYLLAPGQAYITFSIGREMQLEDCASSVC